MHTSPAEMPIAVVLCGRTEPAVRAVHGDFDAWFARGLDEEVVVFAVDEGAEPPDPTRFAGAVLSGSPAMVTDREPWSVRLEEWVRDAHGRLPILGVCYGHQLLAQALGGRVANNPRGTEIGARHVTATEGGADDPFTAGLPDPLVVYESHTQSVLALPDGAAVLMRNAHDPHQAVRYGPTTVGVQFHPEFDAAITRGYVEARLANLREKGHDVEAILAGLERDDVRSREFLRRFRTLCRRRA
ncbi:MAG: glutamine amidotransferase [Planctomycetota bacterium]